NANDAIKSDFKAQEAFKVNEKMAKSMRNLGFGTVLTFREDGLARGTSALVSLSDEAENRVMLKGEAGAHYSLNRGSSRQMYPVSTMGFIALLRQTYMDAEWYQGAKNENFFDNTLEAWNLIQDLPQFFDSRGYLNLLRADKVGDEFGVQYIIKGSGDEYKRLDAIKATRAPLIIPVNFPGKYKVEDPYAARQISLGDMMHWEQAPANPARLAEKGVEFALTTHGLKKKADFWKNLRKAIEYGLSEEDALKALTYIPARLVQADQMIGSIRQGKMANFIISSGNIFASSTSIYENWIQGKPFRMKELNHLDIRGNYDLKVAGKSYMLEIGGKLEAPKFTVMLSDSTKLKTQGSLNQNLIHIRFVADTAKKSESGMDRLSGWVNDKAFNGEGQLADGSWIKWAATQTKAFEAKQDKKAAQKKKTKPAIGQPLYPMVAYGFETKPKSQDMLIKNATVWT
ncbi:MAG: amidohydrolase family protein, partial [Bacteroidota bacterium]